MRTSNVTRCCSLILLSLVACVADPPEDSSVASDEALTESALDAGVGLTTEELSAAGAPAPAYEGPTNQEPASPAPPCSVVPNIVVRAQPDTRTTESGRRVKLTVRLTKSPPAKINVWAVSSDTSEGAVSGTLTFNSKDWQTAKTITVTGVDDTLSDCDVGYTVAIYGRSTCRPNLPSKRLAKLSFTNRDDDQPLFNALGDLAGGDTASQVTAMNNAGDVVVGWSRSAAGDEAVRWTSAGGLVGLGGPQSRAQAVSSDGKLIAGSVEEPTYEGGRGAAIWRGDSPFEILPPPDLTPPGVPPIYYVIDGTVVLNDGTVFATCILYHGHGDRLGCRYRSPQDFTTLGASYVYAADADHYAGSRHSDAHAPSYSRAVFDGASLAYPTQTVCAPNTGCQAAARDYSSKGALIVGTSTLPAAGGTPTSPVFETAFAYSSADGMVRLTDLAGGDEASGAYATSADGRIIAGFGTDKRGRHAVVWINRAPKALQDVLGNACGAIPSGWSLREVRALSPNGRVLAGNGVDPQGNPEGFRVVLARPW